MNFKDSQNLSNAINDSLRKIPPDKAQAFLAELLKLIKKYAH